MKQTEIEDKIIDEISDWRIIKVIINRFDQEEMAKRQRERQKERAEQEAKELARKQAEARYNRPTYYHESARSRGLRMRQHNETVARCGYGSSYF